MTASFLMAFAERGLVERQVDTLFCGQGRGRAWGACVKLIRRVRA